MNTRVRAWAVTAVTIAALAAVALPDVAGAAQGPSNPTLKVSPATLVDGRPATVTVTGRDYLVPPHAPGVDVFGGVYLFFGWVRPGGAWGPSARNSNNNDGVFGVTYSYRGDGGDASTRDDGSGTMRLVAFTRGGESGTSTRFHMDNQGNWTATLNIPSAVYRYRDVSGAMRTTDCRQVQCGVFTIGAHGKSSVTNERFAPITYPAPVTPTTRPPVQSGGPSPSIVPPPPTVAPTIPATTTVTAPDTTRPRATSTTRPPSTSAGNSTSEPTTPDASEGSNARALRESPPGDDGGSPTLWWAVVVVAIVAIAGASFVGVRRRRVASP